jgi:hypothetical protein
MSEMKIATVAVMNDLMAGCFAPKLNISAEAFAKI